MIILILILAPIICFSNLLIMTCQCADPVFLELQCKALKAFCKDPYTFAVFDDAKSYQRSASYKKICRKYNALYYRINPAIHSMNDSPSYRNCNTVLYSLHKLGFKHKGPVMLIDGDLAPIKPFSINSYLKRYNFAGVSQQRYSATTPDLAIEYLWIGFVIMKMDELPNRETMQFNCGTIHGVTLDSGGGIYHYLTQNKDTIRLNRIALSYLNSGILNNPKFAHLHPIAHYNFNCEIFGENGDFLHFGAGSGWNNPSIEFYNKKLNIFKEFIEKQVCKNY
jgi:hypothetical protein